MSKTERGLFEQINECISITIDANERLRVVNKFGFDSIKSICADYEQRLAEAERDARRYRLLMEKYISNDYCSCSFWITWDSRGFKQNPVTFDISMPIDPPNQIIALNAKLDEELTAPLPESNKNE